jgi:DNA (cytosine-5)-methyltransferase 1
VPRGRWYYNDNDPFVVEWLRRLVAAGHLPPGDIDDRSIAAVRPADLAGYTACHFFAGIGGWPLALQLAAWPDDLEVWTGSPPCQPFSTVGRKRGASDKRHLWPLWRDLIGECRPRVVFGEQVEAAIGYAWLCTVRAELEHLGYAVAPVSLCAAGVGAPHIRRRLWFVGESAGGRRAGVGQASARRVAVQASEGGRAVAANWDRFEWLDCRDGKWRPIESGAFPLAAGIPGRVGRLRAYGNALVPALAAEVVGAYLDLVSD